MASQKTRKSTKLDKVAQTKSAPGNLGHWVIVKDTDDKGDVNKDQISGRSRSRPTASIHQSTKPKRRGSDDGNSSVSRDKKKARTVPGSSKVNINEDENDAQDSLEQIEQHEQFEEDGNFIQMRVNADEDDFESKSEDGEIADDSDSRDVSQSESDCEKCTDTDMSASGDEEVICKIKIKKRRKNKKRMEAK